MVTLFEQDIKQNDRQSSKGNQLKWNTGHVWYKADYTGYEGLTEYVISHLLRKSSLSQEEYVLYDLEKIAYKSKRYNGVKSEDFLRKGWQIITLERLFQVNYGYSLLQSIYRIRETEERLKFLVESVERITGLNNFGQYMNKLFTIDAFFLNEDRHMHNIAVLMNQDGEFSYCPIFDNGAGLLADTTMDYPLDENIEEMISEVAAKSICSSFEEQLDVSERIYGSNIEFQFGKNDIDALLKQAEEYYSIEEIQRVKEILYIQMRKYGYLF